MNHKQSYIKTKAIKTFFAFLGVVFSVINSGAQTSIPNTTPVTQDFNSMGTAKNLPANWRIADNNTPTWAVGVSTVTQAVHSGSPNTGGTYNWGESATERCVGSMTSGTWNRQNSLMGYFRNSNAQSIISLNVSYVVKRFRRNTREASIQFFYSLNGTTWTAVSAGNTPSTSLPTGTDLYGFNPPQLELSPLSFNITNLNIANGSDIYLRWEIRTESSYTNSQGTGVDDISVTATFNAGCAAPTTQASNITFSNNTGTGVSMSWTNGNATGGRKVFIAEGSSGTPVPVDGTNYAANPNYTSGDQIGSSGWYCVYSGTLNNVTVAGLSEGTTYRAMVVEYNVCSGSNKYNTSTATNNPNNVTTISGDPEPANHAASFECGTTSDIAIPLTWTDATGGQLPSGYLIKWSSVDYNLIADPADYTPEPNGAGKMNVAYGVENATISGLTPNTTYYFKIFPYSNSDNLIKYKTNGSIPQTSCATMASGVICGSENFTDMPANASAYATRIWTGNDGLTWTATMARTDRTLNGRAVSFGTSGSRSLTSSIYINGMGRLAFSYVRDFTGTESRTLQVYVNGAQIGSDIIVDPSSDASVTYAAITNLTGNITLEIRSTGAGQVKIDDISWTCVSCNFSTLETTDQARSQNIAGINQVDFNNDCSLYASILPGGANPVSGKVDASVVFDPTVMVHQNQPYLQRHFQITPANGASTATATITLFFTQQEFNDFNSYITGNSLDYPLLPTGSSDPNIDNVAVTQFHNNILDDDKQVLPSRVVSWNETKNWWEVSFDVAGFSSFYLHSDNSHPLAIVLSDITAIRQGSSNKINWKVASEALGDQYVLEKSADGKRFESLSTIAATGRSKGYDYLDTNPFEGNSYYRMKLINADGQVNYSKIVVVKSLADNVLNISPNPFVQTLTVNITATNNHLATHSISIEILNINGQSVYLNTFNTNSYTLDLSALSTGMYFLKLINGQEVKIQKIIKE